MKITPLDVGNHRFPRRWRGYDPREVDIFLEMVSQEMEEIIQENHFLSEELKRKSGELLELKEKERLLKDTMITAQKVAEDMKNNMVKEAQVILAQAELEGEQIVRRAYERVMQIQDEIRQLKEERLRFREELRSVIRTYQTLLEAGEEKSKQDDSAGIENTVRVMPQRVAAAK